MRSRVILAAIVLCGSLSACAQQKHSLIIALGDYWKYENFWNDISSENDAELLQEALLAASFPSKNIHIVTNAETKADIIKAINREIIKNVKPGDFVHLHYSGHGQQVADYNGDELDGYDEALVPLAAPGRSKFKTKSGKDVVYAGDAHLSDDELGAVLTRVRKSLGSEGELLVTIDACHSGTATRALGIARGSSIRIEPENYKAPDFYDNETNWIEQNSSDDLARMVTFYASSSQELNYEITGDDGRNYGPLSYGLATAISEGYLNSSFEDMFSRVKQKMAEKVPNQSPFADGLEFEEKEPHLANSTHWIANWKTDRKFELNSGFLSGLSNGSLIEGINDIDIRWRAKIIESNPTTAVAEVIGEETSGLKTTSFVKLTVPNFRKQGDAVCHDIFREDDLKTLKASLGTFDLNSPNCACKLTLRENILKVIDKAGLVVLEETPGRDAARQLSGETINKIRSVLGKIITTQNLVALNMTNAQYNVALEFILLEPKAEWKNPIKPEHFSSRTKLEASDQVIKIKAGSYVEFRITNYSSEPIYYSLLDVMPNGKKEFLFPKEGRSADEYYLEPGESNEHRNQFFQIAPPYGHEIMKLFVSNRPVQWQGLYSTRGADEDISELEKTLFEAINGDDTRSKKDVRELELGISTYHYQIVQ
ncbi:MAG TPA: hypothetical protein DCR04_06905 [Flavobacteriales bacterium]|nr:hypothetical protein [Flavobacteriales bacterium]